jgi:hypothetical protein
MGFEVSFQEARDFREVVKELNLKNLKQALGLSDCNRRTSPDGNRRGLQATPNLKTADPRSLHKNKVTA